MCNNFVHLHVHSEYSLLDGLGRPAQIAKEAARLGQPAVALTDHGVMHGAIEFFRACQKNDVKPIVGVEAYMTPYGRPMGGKDPYKDKANHHILLLAQNMTGYKNLLKLSSAAQLEGFYYKPRIDAALLEQHSEGLICTTGCMAAEIPWLLNEEDGRPPQPDKALERLRWYLDVFGRDRFYVELQEHDIPALRTINRTLLDWSKKHNLELLVTNDVHYVTAKDAVPHDVLLCVQTSALRSSKKRMRFSDEGYYLKSLEEMRATFDPFVDLPDSAFSNSLKIAEMCAIDLEDDSFHLPDLPPGVMPEGFTYETFLRHLTDEGLKARYGAMANAPEIQARKDHELKIIHDMGFDIYYLLVWDMCEFARRENIWWNVRGSGAGSIVAYATGITLIDPLRHSLIFERFLNPGRVSMPDFDLDYPDDQREKMINYTIERYGDDRVAQIVSFGRMKARAALRDVGRVMDMPLSEVDTIAKQVTAIPSKPVTIDETLDPEHEFHSAELKVQYDNDEAVHELVDHARSLEGVARHASVHAAAVIVTDKPLTEYVPVMRAQGSVITKSITQFEFPICESIGLLKVDFLGLSTLTVMRKASELIKARHGIEYTLSNLPMDDPEEFVNYPAYPPPEKAFELLARGDVTGVFQVEGTGMRRVLVDMQPTKFEHIVAAISLFRPGPMEYIPTYIDRMHGREAVEFKHPMLEEILEETYGIIVYQEQIIRIASQLAGYDPGDADRIRKAVGKKKKKEIDAHRSKFVAGAVENGIAQETAEAIYGDIEFFARYGFNKAHAADYALVTCQTAYLKAHYPVEYMTALLTVERGNTEKIGILAGECRQMGIQILPPDINHSGLDFVIEDTPDGEAAIRFSMGAIKNVGDGPITSIIEARDADGPFKDIDDLCSRVDLRQVGRRALEGLVKVGALDSLVPAKVRDDISRGHVLAVLDRMVNLSSSMHKASSVGQISMFDMGGFDAPQTGSVLYPMPDEAEEPTRQEIQLWEKELSGTYLSPHPIQKYMDALKMYDNTKISDLEQHTNGQPIWIAGMINSVRNHQTKKGEPMAYIEVEDMQASCEVVVFPGTYEACYKLLEEGNLVFVKGKVEARNRRLQVLADKITKNREDFVAPAASSWTALGASTPSMPEEPPLPPIDELEPPLSAEPDIAPPPSNGHTNGQTNGHHTPVVEKVVEPVKPPPAASGRVYVTIARRGDITQDKHHLEQIHQFLTTQDGNDPFTIYIPRRDNKPPVEIDFPNHTTRYSDNLVKLLERMGASVVWEGAA